MDTPFDFVRWQPTEPMVSGDATLDPDALEALSQTLADQTKTIMQRPYDPEGWCRRAQTLSQLRYPELALGDAHKASLLCAMHLELLARDSPAGWRLGHGMGFRMLGTPPQVEDLKERLVGLQGRARKLEDKTLSGSKVDGVGKFHPQAYPWLDAQRSSRSDDLLARIDREFADNARHNFGSAAYCRVKRHAFGDAGPSSRDVLGVFAAQDIPAHAVILIDRTRILGCCGPGSDGDMSNLNSALACFDPVHPNLFDEDTGMDLRWVRDATGPGATAALLTVRMLHAAIQDGYEHPLDHPLVARLTPHYRSPADPDAAPDRFYLANDVGVPMRALRQFGVDVFANHHFDTWVLLTVAQRQYNNECGDSTSRSLMPLFSLFNHSCEPNVQWTSSREDVDGRVGRQRPQSAAEDELDEPDEQWSMDHGTVAVKAARDIKRGEQLFVEYDGFEHDKPVTHRRRRLRRWLSGDCMCTRCVREAAEEEALKPQPLQQQTRGGGAEWDAREKVEFPEDRMGSGHDALRNRR